jgi:acetyltransferase-like isoleucine patch superfamily enzyme
MKNVHTIIPDDWYPGGGIPLNAQVDPSAYVASSFSFRNFRSEQPAGVVLEESSSLYDSATLYINPAGRVRFGAFAMMAGGALFCDAAIEIGAYCLVAWNVLIMDSTIVSMDVEERRAQLEAAAFHRSRWLGPARLSRPVRIGRNVWISFSACILPGVTIGDHSIVGARAVVRDDVPPYSVVAGNPARVVRSLDPNSPAEEFGGMDRQPFAAEENFRSV